MKIPPARPFFPEEDQKEILNEIKKCLESGWLTTHENVRKFEDEFAKYSGTKYAIAVNSGTAALQIALMCAGVKENDEVIVPVNTFAATAHAVLACSAKPVFADINEKTFNMDVESLKEKITEKTKVIIPVHIAGQMCEMKEIMGIADDKKMAVVEDCAHAHGSEYNGKKAGSIGIAGCFSFYPTKIITSAEGGMITTNSEEINKKTRIIRDQGKADFYSNEIVSYGFNSRMSELHAILGFYQLKRIEEFISKRQEVAKRYDKALEKNSVFKKPFLINGIRHSWYKYMITAEKEYEKIKPRFSEKGIGTSVCYYPPLNEQPAYRKYALNQKFPNSEILKNVFSLPMFNGMKENEISYVTNFLESFK